MGKIKYLIYVPVDPSLLPIACQGVYNIAIKHIIALKVFGSLIELGECINDSKALLDIIMKEF